MPSAASSAPRFERRHVLGADAALGERGEGRLLQGAVQTGQVAGRRTFATAVGEGTVRLALQVDEDEILAGEQQMAQMQVAATG